MYTIRLRIDNIQFPPKVFFQLPHYRFPNPYRISMPSDKPEKLSVGILVLRVRIPFPSVEDCVLEEALSKVNEENLV